MRDVPHDPRFGPVYEFKQGDFPQRLQLPEGMPYVELSTLGRIEAALKAEYAVYGEGCDGRVFVWPAEEGYIAERFYLGPATQHRFEDSTAAADFAAETCE